MRKRRALKIATAVFGLSLAFGAGIAFAEVPTSAASAIVETDEALALTRYKLPDFNKVLSVIDPNGKDVKNTIDKYGGITFLCVGTYEVRYAAKTLKIEVIREIPEYTLSVGEFEKDSYIAGETLNFPELTVTGDYADDSAYTIEVFLNGERKRTVSAAKGRVSSYFLDEGGAYTFTYVYTDPFGGETRKEIESTVASERVLIADDLLTEYYFGDTLSIGYPFGFFEGETYEVAVSVKMPSGETERLYTPFYTPETLGEYEFIYAVTVAGEDLTQGKKVTVSENPLPFGFLTGSGSVSKTALPAYVLDEQEGVLIEAATSSKIAFQSTVELKGLTKEDDLVRFYAYEGEESGMSGVRVTFSDLYDENNQFSVYWYVNPYGAQHTYCVVDYGAERYGICNEANQKDYGQVRKNYGVAAYDTSLKPETIGYSGAFNLQFDDAENALYLFTRGKQVPLLDLDDPSQAPFNRLLKEFTDGKAFFTIEFVNNVKGGIYLTAVAGEKATALSTTEKNESYIVAEEYRESLPVGAVGYSYRLPVYHSSMILGKEIPVTLTVEKDGREISGVENYAFEPTEAGEYVAVYALSVAGQTVRKEIPFEILASPAEIVVTPLKELKTAFGGYYSLPEFEVKGGSGERSDLTVEYSVLSDGEPIESKRNGSYFVDGKTLAVRVTVRDYIAYEKSFEYDVEVLSGSYFETDGLPKALYAGETFTVPSIGVKTFDGENTEELTATLKIGEESYGIGDTFTVPNEDFVVTLSVGEYEKEVPVSVLNRGKTIKNLFGESEGLQKEIVQSGVLFQAAQSGEYTVETYRELSADGLKFSFAVNEKDVAFDKITLTLTDAEELSLVVEIRDFDFAKGTAKAYLNGDSVGYTITGEENLYSEWAKEESEYYENYVAKYAGTDYLVFGVEIDARGQRLLASNGASLCPILTFTDGNPFDGFFEYGCNAEIAMTATSENAVAVICSLGNVNFSYIVDSLGFADGDAVGPAIAIFGDPYFKQAKLGEEYVVSAAKAFDFVSGEAEVFATVKRSGVKIVENRSAKEPFAITLDQYALYTVEYTAKDGNGKSTTRTVNVEVVDDVFPTVTVNGTYKTEVKLGTKLEILGCEAMDGQGEVAVRIYLRDTELNYSTVSVGDKITLDRKGSYTIVYSVKDEAENITRKTFTVKVV